MEYRLNKLETKTTNHFKINDFEIELEIPEVQNLLEYKIESNEQIIVETIIKNKPLKTKIGLTFPKYIETNITIPKNTVIKNPINITKLLQETIFPNKLNITCEESSIANFIIEYSTSDSNNHWNYTNEYIILKRNSQVSLTYYSDLNKKDINMISYEGLVGKDAKLTHNLIDISGNIRVYNADIDALDYSENIFNMIYLGKNKNKIDINYNFKNIGKKSINNLIVEGSLSEEAHKNFRGIIDFKKGAENATGKERENCVLLSDKCKSRSLPMLLCEEDCVYGAHGESTGKVSKDKLFYLMSRGFSKKEAEQFIIMANFQKIVNEIPDSKLQEKISAAITKKI